MYAARPIQRFLRGGGYTRGLIQGHGRAIRVARTRRDRSQADQLRLREQSSCQQGLPRRRQLPGRLAQIRIDDTVQPARADVATESPYLRAWQNVSEAVVAGLARAAKCSISGDVGAEDFTCNARA